MRENIGHIIRSLRESKNLTQADVSFAASLSLRHYQDIEYGKKKIRIDTLGKILGVHKLNLFNFFELYIVEAFYCGGIQALRSIISSESYTFCRVNSEGLMVEMCERSVEVFGFTRDETVGRKFFWENLANNMEILFCKSLFKLIKTFKPNPMPWTGNILVKGNGVSRVRGYWKYNLNEKGAIVDFEMISFNVES